MFLSIAAKTEAAAAEAEGRPKDVVLLQNGDKLEVHPGARLTLPAPCSVLHLPVRPESCDRDGQDMGRCSVRCQLVRRLRAHDKLIAEVLAAAQGRRRRGTRRQGSCTA